MILETPDDAQFIPEYLNVNDKSFLVAAPHWLPCKGKLAYERRIRYIFFDRGGYVAMAKRYRRYARKHGLLVSLKNKAKRVPQINRLAGAVDIWCNGTDPVSIGEALRSLKIDRAIVHISSVDGYSPKDRVQALEDMGYLAGYYDIYTDLFESGHYWDRLQRYHEFKFPDSVIRTADGSLQKGWYTMYDDGQPYLSYVVCPVCSYQAMRTRVPKKLAEGGYNTCFVDCATSAHLYECYAPSHPLTRSGDRQMREKQLAFLVDRGLVCGSEGGRWWAVPWAAYFEGIMSTALWSHAPRDMAMNRLSGPLAEDEAYAEFDHGCNRRLPLWELVFHDATYVTWWWGDGQLRVPRNWWLKDLWNILYGTMPLWYIQQDGLSLFVDNLDAFAASYARISPVTRAVFGVEMTDHKILAADGTLQRTTWANGLVITVNFAERQAKTPEGDILPGHAFRVDGPAPRFPGLKLGEAIVMPDDFRPVKSKGLLNTSLEAGTLGWTVGPGIACELRRESEGASLRFFGREPNGWTIGGNGAPQTKPPYLTLSVFSNNRWLTNIHTPHYDTGRLGTWQKLQKTFTAPAEADHGYFAVEKFDKSPVSIDMELKGAFFEQLPD